MQLQAQLHNLKNEMFAQSESESQRLNRKSNACLIRCLAFKQEPSKYLEKIVKLMTILNEVDSHTNIADLKTKTEYEKIKFILVKTEADRDKFSEDLNKVTVEKHEMENSY